MLGRNGGEQAIDVTEMVSWGGVTDSSHPSRFTQRQSSDAFVVEDMKRGMNERFTKLPVMVRLG